MLSNEEMCRGFDEFNAWHPLHDAWKKRNLARLDIGPALLRALLLADKRLPAIAARAVALALETPVAASSSGASSA